MGKFKGIIPALITPFSGPTTEIYLEGIENELKYLKDNEFENIFLCGSYGSFPLMNISERKVIAEKALDFCKKNGMKTIIHIGSTSISDSLELAKHAASHGADAISSVVPFYYSSTFYNENTFLDYFETLVREVSVDVHCYNNTKTTGFNVSPSFLKKLIDVGVMGIKDGGSDTDRMLKMMEVSKSCEGFSYYPSSTNSLLTAFLLGVESCISGVSLSAPVEVKGVYDSITNGDIETAVRLYKKVMKVRSLLGETTGRAIAAYDILHSKGIDVGTCRKPWKRLSNLDRRNLLTKFNSMED